jgi:hypothetical protein
MRMEETGSLTFSISNNKVRMYDYGNTTFRGDIFDLVGLITNNNTLTKDGFVKICKHIIDNSAIGNIPAQTNTDRRKSDTIIKFEQRHWDSFGIRFWLVGIHTKLELLKEEGVYPVDTANVISHSISYYNYVKTDPCYAYFFDLIEKKSLIKLYFPLRDKTKVRFITNNKYNFEGINRLYKADNLVITKSYKDRIILRSYLPERYCVTNLSSESIRLSVEEITALRTVYKTIYLNTDYDPSGIVTAFYHYYKYKLIPIFIGNKVGGIPENTIKGLYHDLPSIQSLEVLYQKLSKFKDEFKGEYEYKDFYELAVIVSPNVLKDYINYKFKVL